MTGAMWGVGTVMGPVVGGGFADSSASWRWAFYLLLPIGALGVPIMIFLILPFDALRGMSVLHRLKRIDWIGFILHVGWTTALVVGLQSGGNEFAWDSKQVIGAFVTFAISLVLFAFSQTLYMPGQTKERRIFPVEMIFNRTTVLAFILTATSTTTVYMILYYLPLHFQFILVRSSQMLANNTLG